MKSLESMINKLLPLGVYNLSGGSINYAELSAFSAGLELLRQSLDELLKESFVITSETYGIENLEKLCGSVRDDLPIEKRREMLTQRLSLSTADFTPKGFEKMLRTLGVEGRIEEYPEAMRIVINLSDEELTEAQKEWVLYQAEALLPAHLDFDVVFSGFDWKVSDALGNTFGTIDSKGYCWKEIDYSIQEEI